MEEKRIERIYMDHKYEKGYEIDLVKANIDLTVHDIFAIMHNVYMNTAICDNWDVSLEIVSSSLYFTASNKIEDDFFNMWKMYCREIKGYELKINMEAE